MSEKQIVDQKPSWMRLEDFLALPEMSIEPETLDTLKELDRQGFHFRTISLNGSYFECMRGPDVKRFEP